MNVNISLNFIIKLSKYSKINNYLINFSDNKQMFYNLIYSIKLVELKILKLIV